MKKKFNLFKWIGGKIRDFFCWLLYIIIYILIRPFVRCKIKGKKNINKSDEAQVFIFNHYEIYGPFSVFLCFPYKFRPWVIDKMTDPETVEQQMSLSIYNNFKSVPRWIKTCVIKMIKYFMVFVMKHAKAIPVSRDNPRANLVTMQTSSETLNSGKALAIFPEKDYVPSGVGKFMTGFEYIGKYHFQKTGKKISFYPVFVSEMNRTMYIGKPVVYNPYADPKEEKERIVYELRDDMLNSYIKYECGKPAKKKHKRKK